MAKEIILKAKQDFSDKYTKVDYKKGKSYSFSEKRAEELLKNPYLVEKVKETELEEEKNNNKVEENKTNK